MTKEELLKEAEEKYNERLKQIGYKIKYRDETYIDGYLDGAGPREKENAELNEQVLYLKDNLRVARKDREDLQLEVGKGLQEFIKDCPYTALKLYANEKYVEENTELKEEKKMLEQGFVWHDYDAGEDCYEDTHEGGWEKRNDIQQLTKAKEIIKKLVDGVRVLNDPKVELTDCDGFLAEAEQFIKEIK